MRPHEESPVSFRCTAVFVRITLAPPHHCLPAKNAGEAAVVEGLDVISVESLSQAVAFFAGEIDIVEMTHVILRPIATERARR